MPAVASTGRELVSCLFRAAGSCSDPSSSKLDWYYLEAADGEVFCLSSQYSLSMCRPRIVAHRSYVPFQDPRKCVDLLLLKRFRRLERVSRLSANGGPVRDGSFASVRSG